MPTCVNHPYQEAQHRCPDCGMGYCDACVVEFLGQRICGPCRDRRLQQMTGPTATAAPLAGTGVVDLGGWLAGGWALIQQDLLTWALALLVGGLISRFTCQLADPAIHAGYYLMAYRKMSTGAVDLGNLFDGFRRFGYSLLFLLLQVVAYLAVVMLISFPLSIADTVLGSESTAYSIVTFLMLSLLAAAILVIHAATFFALPHIAAKNSNPVDAITASLEVFRRNWGMFVALTFVWGLVYVSGVLLCGIGLFITAPLVMAATAKAYADHFGIAGWDAI